MKERQNNTKISQLMNKKMAEGGFASIRKLAISCDICELTVYRIMANTHYPSVPNMVKICNTLKIEPKEFIEALLIEDEVA